MLRLAALSLVLVILWVPFGQAKTRRGDPPHQPGFEAGQRLYRDGVLPSGALLRGDRDGGLVTEGRGAACANCHRRSGMGSQEGSVAIPAITGSALFRPSLQDPLVNGVSSLRGAPAARTAYDDASLARAIRDGIGRDGRPLSYLMPRFHLDEKTMASLIAYLRGLSRLRQRWGNGDDALHFATIVTPDADAARRRGMLDVLRVMFAMDDPSAPRGAGPDAGTSLGRSAGRTWLLHVWELRGAPGTWEQQLRERFRAQPVFAVVSGAGGTTWEPVQRFCELEQIPCLLPNVDLPPATADGFYSVYFNGGVRLEARLMAKEIRDRMPGLRRVVQLFRREDIGKDAAAALAAELRDTGLRIVNRALDASGFSSSAPLADSTSGDAIVLWLRPADLTALPRGGPRGTLAIASGLMGGLEHAPLPEAWRARAELTYPFELPGARAARMDYPLGWLRIHGIQLQDERIQTDTYLACVILSDLLVAMHGYFSPDYLLERLESGLDHRLVNGYYPRLALAPGQRFASKGARMVRFAQPVGGTRLQDVSGWVVP